MILILDALSLITPTLRFKCQDIIRFPTLPTKHNPQALRTGGEIHQYFFGWIDTSRIDVVGRRHLSIDNYVHTHIVRRTIFAPRREESFVSATYSQNTSITFLTFGKKLHIFVSSDSQCLIDSGISSHSFWWHKETSVSFSTAISCDCHIWWRMSYLVTRHDLDTRDVILVHELVNQTSAK